jgi:hypothetical protein
MPPTHYPPTINLPSFLVKKAFLGFGDLQSFRKNMQAHEDTRTNPQGNMLQLNSVSLKLEVFVDP